MSTPRPSGPSRRAGSLRPCARTGSTVGALAGVAAAYAVLLAAAHANPTRARPHAVELQTQALGLAASVAVLLVVRANCVAAGARSRPRVSWGLAGLLAASLAARVALLGRENQAAFGTWDALASTVSVYAVVTQLFLALAPPGKRWSAAYASTLLVGLPLLAAVAAALRELGNPRPDPDELSLAAGLSNAAYFDEPTVADERTGTEVLVLARPGTVYVSFTGTEDVTDAKTDADVRLADLPADLGDGSPCKVHGGFLRAYLSVRQGVRAAVADALERGGATGVVTCGHSLGGALATLAALDLATAPARGGTAAPTAAPAAAAQVRCYSFGSPQVGDPAFVLQFRRAVPRSVRVVNPYDLVPRSLSAVLEHVHGQYAVAFPAPAFMVLSSHSMDAYEAAVRRGRPATWAMLLLLHPAYALVGVLVVLGLNRALNFLSAH